MNNDIGMVACADDAPILAFCHRAPMQYRHLISDIEIPCPQWREAYGNYYGVSAQDRPLFYVDDVDKTNFLAAVFLNRLRIEGDATSVTEDAFLQWCQDQSFLGYATTSDPLMYMLRRLTGPEGWSHNLHFEITPETFRSQISHKVAPLTALDRAPVESFLAQPSTIPFLSIGRAVPGLARDFCLTCAQIPVYCYAAYINEHIVGIVSIQPMTTFCDELSELYVAPDFRRRGVGYSLLSTAIRDTLERGKILGAASNTETGPQFRHLGFRVVSRFWHLRFWHDTPRLT